MPRQSSGLLVFRHRAGDLEVLLVHPGGPLSSSRSAACGNAAGST
jgi:predicted NUDIX family NTP pyrophosphohydrolase